MSSAFAGEGVALCLAKGISAATGRKKLGHGVSKVDSMITFDFVVKRLQAAHFRDAVQGDPAGAPGAVSQLVRNPN